MTNLLHRLISRDDISALAHNEGLYLDDDTRISILESMRSIDVQACPGSGKTTLIAAKLMLLAKKWPFPHQGICVLSHTNVAKDEIIERLKKSKTTEAQSLLSYPHFIGTIQEFVGKFLAFPYLRARKIDINCVDTDMCVELIYSNLSYEAKARIDRANTHSNVLYNFDINLSDGELSINVPTFKNKSNSPSYKNLKKVRLDLIKKGCLFYRDVFTFAQVASFKVPSAIEALRNRFPFVFLDEMQDTQKFQDELLLKIFPQDDPNVIIQRFGDPDQAIFHGSGKEESNSSFNGKSVERLDFVVQKSHRFDGQLADKIKPLSINKIQLETELTGETLGARSLAHSSGGSFEHSVIVFNDETRGEVIQAFGDIVSQQFHKEYKNSDQFIVKALGAVGNEIDPSAGQLKIGHYWPDYKKSKSNTNFKENSLIEAVRYCRYSNTSDWSHGYKLLLDCILKLLRLAEKSDESGHAYSSTSLQAFLKLEDRWYDFRERLFQLLGESPLNQVSWEEHRQCLITLLGLQDATEAATRYLEYSEEELNVENQNEEDIKLDDGSVIPSPNNKVKHPDGFHIHLSTIHGVKGETHDATLVLETKNHEHDIHKLLEHLTVSDTSEIKAKRKVKFARQLYVGVSRPRHLLCLAIHEDRINDGHKAALESLGWKVLPLKSESL